MNVIEGKSVYIDYSDSLEGIVNALFTLPNDERLVHMSRDILPQEMQVTLSDGWYSSWYFPDHNRLFDVFDPFVHYSFDSGLRHEWLRRTK